MRRLKPVASSSGARYPRYRSFWTSLGLLLSVGPAAALADASLPQPKTSGTTTTTIGENKAEPRPQPQPIPQAVPVLPPCPGLPPAPVRPPPPQPQPRQTPEAPVRKGGVKPSARPVDQPTLGRLGVLHPHGPDEPCFTGGQVLVALRTPRRGGEEA